MPRSGAAARARVSASARESGGPSARGGVGAGGRSATSACARGAMTVVGRCACAGAASRATGARSRMRGIGGRQTSGKVAVVSTGPGSGFFDAAGPKALAGEGTEPQRPQRSRRDEAEIFALRRVPRPGKERHVQLTVRERLVDFAALLQCDGLRAARVERDARRPSRGVARGLLEWGA